MIKKKKIIFIVNLNSGTQGKKNNIKIIRERIAKKTMNYVIVETKHAGHAVDLAKEAADNGADVVVAIGGDGTVNEIARSLIHTNTTLGIIPCGSGNGLARHLGIPMEIKGAVDIINNGETVCIDYGKINSRLFFCTCGVGFDAFVSLKFADSKKRGLLTYLENTLHVILPHPPRSSVLAYEARSRKH